MTAPNTSPSILDLPGGMPRDLLAPGAARTLLEETILPSYIPRCRWFSGKARDPQRFQVRDLIPISERPDAARLTLVDVTYAEGPKDTWLLPLQILGGEAADELVSTQPNAILARFEDGVLHDALHDVAFRAGLFHLMSAKARQRGERGEIVGDPGPAVQGVEATPDSRVHAVEQSNSSVIYGDQIFLKLYRRIEAGMNPDAEILRFLSRQGFAHVPPYAGSVEYRETHGHCHVLSLATGLVANHGDAWSFTLRELTHWFAALWGEDHTGAKNIETELQARIAQLGMRTGELHLALAAQTADPDFAAEPLSAPDAKGLAENILDSADQIGRLITARLDALPSPELGRRYLTAEPALRSRVASLAAPLTASKTRTHGDYHLGQVLETGSDFVIIDFEGEPLRSLAARREKRSPYRDVAGMLRSFDYAAHAALDSQSPHRAMLAPQADEWTARAQAIFREAWLKTTQGAPFRAATEVEEKWLLDAFLLEKALYEVLYEINNRPTWLHIPLHGVLGLLEK
jgi:trehalose synthase-fused probable maltokinase